MKTVHVTRPSCRKDPACLDRINCQRNLELFAIPAVRRSRMSPVTAVLLAELAGLEMVRGYFDSPRKLVVEAPLALIVVQLMQAGMEGCTPARLMRPGLSLCIYQLRKAGVVETMRTNEPDTAAGLCRRYILRGEITISDLVLIKAFRNAA